MEETAGDADGPIRVQGKGFHCSLCDINIANETSVQDHLKGKKHQRLTDLKKCRLDQADHSVFVGGLNKLMSELVLTDHFMKFGSVSKVIIDKDKGKYAIVEFTEKESVTKAVKQEKQTLYGCKMTVRPREHKEFSVQAKKSKGGAGDKSSMTSGAANMYGRIPSELQKAIVMRLSPVEDVSNQMKELVSLLELPPSGIRLRYLICTLLQEVFKEFFPACQVYPFGSSVNGFGILGCDLDLHLEPNAVGFTYKFAKLSNQDESMETNDEEDDSEDEDDDKEDMIIDLDKASPKDIMELVCKVLRQCVPSCQNIKAILHARRPVVKFQHKDSKLNGDISMNNRLAMRNTELLHYCTTLDDRVRPLVYTIRHWAKARMLASNPGGAGPRLTNYALSLMVVYYLQTKSPAILPTVEQLREDSSSSELIEGWDCSFSTDAKKTTNTETLVDLLRDFFHFYSTFDFTTMVISTRTGSAHPISTFAAPESPVHKGCVFRLSAINIQDPFELSHNVAFNVNDKVVHNLRKEVKKAYTLCLCNKFKRKKGLSLDEGSLGLPVLFDAANYNSGSNGGGGKKERKTSTSTEGSVSGDGRLGYSFAISMKASQLSEAFVKSHSNSQELRMAWWNATTTLIKHILCDVLMIQCEERTSDKGEAVSEVKGSPHEGADCKEHKTESNASGPSIEKMSNNEELSQPRAVMPRKHVLGDDEDVDDLPSKRPKLTADDDSLLSVAHGDESCNPSLQANVDTSTVSDVNVVDGQTLEQIDADGMDKEESQQSDKEEKPYLTCSSSHQVWIGRRKVRRHLNQTNPHPQSQQLTFENRLCMETLATKHIISQETDSPSSSSSLSVAKTLTKFHLLFEEPCASDGESSMKLVFQPLQGLEHFKMLFQFLQTFLVKYVDQNKI